MNLLQLLEHKNEYQGLRKSCGIAADSAVTFLSLHVLDQHGLQTLRFAMRHSLC